MVLNFLVITTPRRQTSRHQDQVFCCRKDLNAIHVSGLNLIKVKSVIKSMWGGSAAFVFVTHMYFVVCRMLQTYVL